MLRRLTPVLAFACGIAAIVILIGPGDLESYETAFFSLDRGTAVQSEYVLGHPVYTLSLGLGLRLPLHGSLGASPAAAIAPYVPMPVTYGLLLVFAIASAVVVVRYAIEPICGRLVSWLTIAHLFCSLPIVTYTIASDWPEIVLAYIAIVACMCAPHALLTARDVEGSTSRRVVRWSIAGLVWSLVSVAHSGYWPHLAVTLVCAALLALLRWDHPFRARVGAVTMLAFAAMVPVALQTPDIFRELSLASTYGLTRFVQGPVGNVVVANLFPFVQVGARMPFTNLLLAFVALVIGVRADTRRDRWLILGSALASVLLGIAASTLPPGSAVFAPSNTWAMRDYAGAFAVLSGACAAGTVIRSTDGRWSVGTRTLLVALALASLQGPLYAWRLVAHEMAGGGDPGWTRELSSAEARMLRRGVSRDRVELGARLALWPGARARMQEDRANTADFPDAGYELVTTIAKDRTMRGLIEPNDLLFNQSTQLAIEILCDTRAVRFLQLRYLLAPPDVTCPPRAESSGEPWGPLPGVLVDGWLEARETLARDDQARALPVAAITDAVARAPALSVSPVVSGFLTAGASAKAVSRTSVSPLLSALVALPGTSLRVGPRDVVVRADDVSRFRGQAIVLPVAYDSAWSTSSGSVRNVGGLLAVLNVDQPSATLTFVPDAAAILLALGMTMAQLLACGGLIGLASVRAAPIRDDALTALDRNVADFAHGWGRRVGGIVVPGVRRAIAVARQALREPQNLLCLLFGAAVIARPQRADQIDLFTALLLPLTTLAVARAAHWRWLRSWLGVTVLAAALVRVMLGGSRAAEALHDPLFWGIVAFVCAGAAVFTGRWPIVAVTASAVAGATAAIATLLPYVPDFDVAFPALHVAVISRSLTAMSDQFGLAATAFLIAVWVYGIAFTWRRGHRQRVPAGARGALLGALIACLLGALPPSPVAGSWMLALGALLGIAGANEP